MASRTAGAVPPAFLDGRFTLPLLGLWVAFSCSRWFGVTGYAGLPDVTLERLFFGLLVGYAVTTFAMRKQAFGRLVPAEIGLLIFALASGVSGYLHGAFDGSEPEAINTLTDSRIFPAIAFMIVLRTRTTRQDLLRLSAVLTIFALYLGITALFEKASFNTGLMPPAIGDPSQGIHFGRARGPYLNAAFNGTVMAQLLPMVLLSVQLGNRSWRVVALIAAGLLCLGVYLTDTRACLLGLVAVALVGSLVSGPSRKTYRALLGVLLLGGVIQYVGGREVVPRLEQEDPVNVRLNMLLATGEIVIAHPIVGSGFRTFGKVNEEYFMAGRVFGGRAYQDKWFEAGSHNTLFTPIAELGLFVGGLYLFLLCRAVVNGLYPPISGTAEERSLNRQLLIASVLVGIPFLINGLAVEFQSSLTPNALFWAFAGFGERHAQIRKAAAASTAPAGGVHLDAVRTGLPITPRR